MRYDPGAPHESVLRATRDVHPMSIVAGPDKSGSLIACNWICMNKDHRKATADHPSSHNPSKFMSPPKFIRNHQYSLLLIAIQIPITSYLMAIYINNPPPSESTLERAAITVVAAKKYSPHLQIKKGDGNVYLAEFPVTTGIRPKEFSNVSDTERKALVGCNGIAATTPLLGAIPARLNVWEIDCGGVLKSYKEILISAMISRKAARSTFNLYLIISGALIVYFFILEEIALRRTRKQSIQPSQTIQQGK